MLLNYLRTTVVFTVLFSSRLFAQFPGCPNVDAGADQVLPCSQTCTNLTATPFHSGGTTTYAVGSIAHTPPISYNEPGGNPVSVATDDVFSPVINLPFNFCYYGVTYTQCLVGSNGTIRMGNSGPGTFSQWNYTASCPSAALSTGGDIFGVYHDTDPTKGNPTGTVKWYLTGTAPCRIFVVVFNNLAHYGASCAASDYRSTSMIVLYETTNAIDVYVQSKPTCPSWNGGRAIIGIQNPAGSVGIAAPGRNAATNWNVTAPEGWRFTPNGAPIYTTAWFQGATQIGTGNTINVCPTGPTTYTVRTTYNRCDGTQIVEEDQVNVSYSTLPPATVTPTAETCNNLNNGSVTINNPVGAGPYTVNITGPTSASTIEPNTAAGVATFNSLPDGNYNYTVTGANGCTISGSFTINPGPVCCSVTASATNVACNGGTTGSTTANPVGMAPFTYAWTGGQTGQTATNLGAGTYTVTLTDNIGCTATATVTVTAPTAVTATSTVVNALCSGACNGSITVNASGGTAPYQYSINGGAYQASNAFTGLCAGSYTVTVRDANNCLFVINPSVTQPAPLTLTLGTVVPATCGANNGSITVSAGGGTTAYTYSIGGVSQASGTFTGRAPGTYTVTVTDAHGCTASVTATVTAQNAPVASIISQQNVSCFGGANGSVLIGSTGGVAPILYSLNGGPFQASNSFGPLTAGTYTATVRDANNCTATVSVTITSPPQLTFTSVATAASCNGVCDGQIQVTAAGGTAPYQFSSNNGGSYSPANPITGLCAGAVNLVVQDANGCLANGTVTITQPAPVSGTFTHVNPVCNDLCNGSVTATPAGGTPAYQFSANGGALQTSPTLTGLCAGNNTILIRDSHGCQFTSVQVLTDPPAMTITQTSNVSSNCGFNNGEIVVSGSGVNPPFQYSINGAPFQASGTFSNLLAGAYHIYITDALGCMDSVFFGVNDIEMEGIVLSQTDVTCFGGNDGTIEVSNVSGAPPITYEMDNSGSTQTNGVFTGIEEGSHIVTIYDNGFCIYTLPFMMIEPTEVGFSSTVTDIQCNGASTGQITFSGSNGGTGSGYQYSIDNGTNFQPSPNFTGLPAGSYNLVVMDGANCPVTGTATINQTVPISFTYSVFDLQCFGDNSGFIQLVAAGGVGPYQYSIDNGATFSTTDNFSSLAAGTYNVVVRDNVLCEVTGTVTVNQPPQLAATYAPSPTLCNGACNGSIAVTASGGTTSYQYSGDNGVTFGVNPVIANMCAGTYTVIVKDAHNCTVSSSQTVTQPTPVTFTTALTPSTCSLPNGQITFSATGGIPGYTYSIDNGASNQNTTNFNGLAATTYNLIVTDANLCTATGQATVINQASPVITAIFADEPLCNAACNGQITISATGGTGTLDYSIGGANQAANIFTGICAGTYTITVTDDNGCTDSDVITIAEPAPLAFTTALTNLTCFQNNTGQIVFTATGGTTPYEYSLNNGTTYTTQSTNSFLAAGTYNLIVRDDQNCTATAQVQLTQPADLVIQNQVAQDASCHGFCDGAANVTVTGGTGAYNYDWAGGVAATTSNTALDLCAGSYDLEVTDANGCDVQTTFTIGQPPLLVITSTSATDALCNGSCDGTISINAALAVEYSIDGGTTFQPGSTFTGLCAGTYAIIVRDAAGCTQGASIVINEPQPLVQDVIPEDGMTICYDGFGTLSANATGGTQPYYFVWNTGDTAQFLNVNLTAPATFTCTVYDQNGCVSGAQSADVAVRAPFVASVNAATVSVCPGGQAVLGASGVDGLPGYTYEWLTTPAHDTLGGGDSYSYTPTVSETILLVARDECYRYDTIPVNVVIFDPPQPTFTVTPPLGCSPLTATFTNNMNPANVASSTWTFGDGTTGTGNSVTNVYTQVGCYDVTLDVVSTDGCVGQVTMPNVVCVAPDPVANFSFNPQQPTTVNSLITFTDQSSGAVAYNWNFAGEGSSTQENPMFNFGNILPGSLDICLTVTSAEGCTDQICKPITFTEEFTVFVPNAFTPDNDEFNPTFLPVFPPDAAMSDYTLTIYNRWGEVLFESHNQFIGWDGTYHDAPVKEGAYTWSITVRGGADQKNKRFVGHVTLIR